jgi:hypothetical protein
MFDALTRLARQESVPCTKCGVQQELWLEFHFALSSGEHVARAIAAVAPGQPSQWELDGRTILFHPFLVLTQTEDKERFAWWPYWHTVKKGGREYLRFGQWASYFDVKTCLALIEEARARSLLL